MLKADRQALAIWAILRALGKKQHSEVQTLHRFKQRSIPLYQQPFRNVYSEFAVYAKEVGVECRMVDL